MVYAAWATWFELECVCVRKLLPVSDTNDLVVQISNACRCSPLLAQLDFGSHVTSSVCDLQDPIYAPHLAMLVKLLFLSSAIHQLAFVLCSTLPFAVGQVQDVGLIFLSAMASSVAGEGVGSSGKVLAMLLLCLPDA